MANGHVPPRPNQNTSLPKNFIDFSSFRSDLFGGITAGVVALPLALAFGEQSGLGAASGLYGAAFIAFFASLFGGTPTQISGPTAPMTALSMIVVAGLLQTFEGRLEEALPVILMVFFLAGVFQVILGFLKLGSYIRFIPYTVVSGFMTGIGVIILITQIPAALGYYAGEDQEIIEYFKPHAEELILDRILKEEAEDGILVLEEFRETINRSHEITEEDILREAEILAESDGKGVIGALRYLRRALKNINFVEFVLAALTILIIYGFRKVTRSIPSTLVALIVVSSGAWAYGADYRLIQEIPSGLPRFRLDIFSDFSIVALAPYLVTAFMLSLLGSIDSLLTSVVADNLTKTRHDSNRELIGQGVGNGVAAVFGGIPGAGATIRTVVNIQAGGKTKLSGMISGILLFVILLLLGPIASNIPAAVLAGILITVGIGVMDYKGLRALPRMQLSEKIILVTVLLLTVFWQLVYAVGVGLVLAAVVFLKQMGDISAQRVVISDLKRSAEDESFWGNALKIPDELREKVLFKRLNGPLFFGFTARFRTMVSNLPEIKYLVLQMEGVPFIDQSGIQALEAVFEEMEAKGVTVAISGPNERVVDLLKRMKLVPGKLPESLVFRTNAECKEWIAKSLQ